MGDCRVEDLDRPLALADGAVIGRRAGELLPANFTTLNPAVLAQLPINPGKVAYDIRALCRGRDAKGWK